MTSACGHHRVAHDPQRARRQSALRVIGFDDGRGGGSPDRRVREARGTSGRGAACTTPNHPRRNDNRPRCRPSVRSGGPGSAWNDDRSGQPSARQRRPCPLQSRRSDRERSQSGTQHNGRRSTGSSGSTDGKCFRAELLRSAMTCSTMAWSRWWASAISIGSVLSVNTACR